MNKQQTEWDIEVRPQRSLLDFRLGEIWEYRDLLEMFIKRDIVTIYKQTVLGPIWYFIQPLLMMMIFIIVFSNIAKIPTDGVPPAIFYLAGIILWNYFSDCLTQTADTFYQNMHIFGKVYFPRVIVPLSKVISALIKFLIQSVLFAGVYLYLIFNGADIAPNKWVILLPVLILIMGCLGMGLGMIVTSITAKYRDLKFLITFAVQILMYLSPVIYPVSALSDKYSDVMFWNPFSHLLESFRFCVLGTGEFNLDGLVYTGCVSLLLLFVAIVLFNKTEQTFVDTI